MKVGFIGLGKLGMPCAETIAEKYAVTGYDIYPKQSSRPSGSFSLVKANWAIDSWV